MEEETVPIHTNIVVSDPELVGEPVQPDPSTDQEGYSRRLAQDAIQFLEQEEFKDDTTCVFWEVIRDAAIERIEKKEKSNFKPMSADEVSKFANMSIPWGKYLGQKVLTVLRKDRNGLEMLASQPLFFQTRLKRFLGSSIEKLANPTPKKKPKRKK